MTDMEQKHFCTHLGLSKLTSFPVYGLKRNQILRLSVAFVLIIAVFSAAPLVFIGNLVIVAEAKSSKPLPTINTIPSAPSTIDQDGSDFTTQAALTGVSARQTNNIVGAQSYYDVIFVTSTTGTIKFIDITFPAGTVIGASPLLVEREGIGAGTAAKTSATVIRYTVTSAVSVPAGTQIRLEFFNIVNPTLPNTGYKVTVTTRNAAGTAIDGPTLSNSLNMKQIGSNQVAESFMKRVTLTDSPIGNSLGWNPNGVTTDFLIDEPSILDLDESLVSINLGFGDNVCTVDNLTPPSTFEIKCATAPLDSTELYYVVFNLPPHFDPL